MDRIVSLDVDWVQAVVVAKGWSREETRVDREVTGHLPAVHGGAGLTEGHLYPALDRMRFGPGPRSLDGIFLSR